MDIKVPRAKRYKKQMTRYASVDCKHDRSLLPFSAAKMFYNFDFSSGVLRRGYGVKSHPHVPSVATRYWIYRFYSEKMGGYVERYVYQYGNGLLAYYKAEEDYEIFVSGIAFNPLDIISYRIGDSDVFLLSCEGRKLVSWDGVRLKEYSDSPSIKSMALHYERLFVTSRDERTKVYFSKNLDPTQWDISADGGGFIELLDERGFLNKVVSFGSYLYIFRDHGISRVTAYGEQSDFSVVNMFVTAGRIYPSSIATCGNCIMFLASDGIYTFDGFDCNRVLADISPSVVPDDNCASAYYNGKYYLACKMDFKDGRQVGSETSDYKTNGLIIYDPCSGEYSISRGLDISFMSACTYDGQDYLMCCEGGRGGVLELGAARFEDELPAYWESGETDFSAPGELKYLTAVLFNNNDNGSTDNVDLSIAVDGDKYSFHVTCPNQGNVGVNLSGVRFAFSLETSSAAVNVTPLCVKYNMY